MNISKKAIMSFIVALTSAVSMAQPYYHIMKDVNGKLTEETGYNGMEYIIKIDMEGPRPKDAIGNKITIEGYDCDWSKYKRSFYFTKNGNVYYNESEGKFHFEESQLDYPKGTYSKDHCGHFRWGRNINECIDTGTSLSWPDATEDDFYFANPDNLPKLQEDLGNERWGVLSACEWYYIILFLGEIKWTVDGYHCYLIDTTPDQKLRSELRDLLKKKHDRSLSIEEFKSFEARGLVCLPFAGYREGSNLRVQEYLWPGWDWRGQGTGDYWACTPIPDHPTTKYKYAQNVSFVSGSANMEGRLRSEGLAVRLVILAND